MMLALQIHPSAPLLPRESQYRLRSTPARGACDWQRRPPPALDRGGRQSALSGRIDHRDARTAPPERLCPRIFRRHGADDRASRTDLRGAGAVLRLFGHDLCHAQDPGRLRGASCPGLRILSELPPAAGRRPALDGVRYDGNRHRWRSALQHLCSRDQR